MNKYLILFVCLLLCLACAAPVHKDKDNDVLNAKKMYKHYLNNYYMGGGVSDIDSALSFINSIPEEMASWTPEYKLYLRFKCKAILAKETGDVNSYRNYLDSIIIRWEPVALDSIGKCDTIFSKPIDSIPSHLWFLCENYYEIVSVVRGKDFVVQTLSSKKINITGTMKHTP